MLRAGNGLASLKHELSRYCRDIFTAQKMVKLPGDHYSLWLLKKLSFVLYLMSLCSHFIYHWLTSSTLFLSPVTLATLSSPAHLVFVLPLRKSSISLDFYSAPMGTLKFLLLFIHLPASTLHLVYQMHYCFYNTNYAFCPVSPGISFQVSVS